MEMMLMRHLRANAPAWARVLRAPPENLPSKLATLGVATCGAALRAAAAFPPAEGMTMQLGAAALAFVAGLCAIWAALWVAADARRRGTVGHVLLCVFLVPLLVAIGLSSSQDSELIFDIVFDALA